MGARLPFTYTGGMKNNDGYTMARATQPTGPATSISTSTCRLRIWSAALLPGMALLAGCQVLTYRSPSGETFSRTSLGARTAVAGLMVETSTNGVRRLELHGYQNDTAESLTAVTEAAVRAALQSSPSR
jgi:hypothetical protein